MSQALEMWKKKLDRFQQQEAIVSDPAQKFTLAEQIEEAKSKIAELETHVNAQSAALGPGTRWVSNVPFARNPYFTGRDDLLREIHERLKTGGATRRTEALTGLGGIGKTQTAIEYGHRYADDYDCVWWVRAEDPATLAADYADLARELALEAMQSKELKDRVQAVRAWFDQHDRWLLVFDNAPDAKSISEYRPRLARGHVLVTSRDASWAGVAVSREMRPLAEADAVTFLCARTGDADRTSALELARTLGALPLALEQACAYAERTGKTLAQYLDLFTRKQSEVLKRGEAIDYPATVATTWELSFQAIESSCPAAVDVLRIAAWLSPDRISRQLFTLAAGVLPEPLASAVTDEIELDDALAELRRYSLVRVESSVLTVHRLVQAITRTRMDAARQSAWSAAALRAIGMAFESDAVYDDNAFRRELLAHVRPAVDATPGCDAEPVKATQLLWRLARHQRDRGEKALARRAFEDALKIFGAHETVDRDGEAVTNLALADLLCEEGDFEGSVAHYERGLERVLGASFSVDPLPAVYKYNVDPPRSAANLRWVCAELRGYADSDTEEITIDLAQELVAAFGLDEGEIAQTELGCELRCLRWRLWEAYGVALPAITPRPAVGKLPERTYLISVDGVPVSGMQLPLATRFVHEQRNTLELAGIPYTSTCNPLNGRPAAWVDNVHAAALIAADIVSDGAPFVVALHVQAVLDWRLGGFLSHQDVADLLRIHLPEDEAVAADASLLSPLASVLRGLLEERVPIRSLQLIVEQLRAGLADARALVQIVEDIRNTDEMRWLLPGMQWRTQYFRLEPALEAAFARRLVEARTFKGEEQVLALEPELTQELLAAVRIAIAALPTDAPPVAMIVREPSIRPHLRRVVELEFPHMPVVAEREVADWMRERVIGTIRLETRTWTTL
jgi:hypothetical protein